MPNEVIEKLAAHPLVYGNERCVTFQNIDEMHERPTGTAKNAFHRNRDRMTDGKHYYSMPLKDFRELSTPNVPNSTGRGNPNQPVFLLTEKGYCLIAKVFDDALGVGRLEHLAQLTQESAGPFGGEATFPEDHGVEIDAAQVLHHQHGPVGPPGRGVEHRDREGVMEARHDVDFTAKMLDGLGLAPEGLLEHLHDHIPGGVHLACQVDLAHAALVEQACYPELPQDLLAQHGRGPSLDLIRHHNDRYSTLECNWAMCQSLRTGFPTTIVPTLPNCHLKTRFPGPPGIFGLRLASWKVRMPARIPPTVLPGVRRT